MGQVVSIAATNYMKSQKSKVKAAIKSKKQSIITHRRDACATWRGTEINCL